MRETFLLRHALPDVHLIAGPQAGFAAQAWAGEEALGPASRAARTAARALLQETSAGPAAIGRGKQGEPQFPSGLRGSLAHSAQACAAALSARAQGLGVDLEPLAELPADARAYALTVREQAEGGDSLARFCAKECVHKALNPLTGAWLEFSEMEIVLEGAQGFGLRPLSAAARTALQGLRAEGRWWRLDDHCLALLALY